MTWRTSGSPASPGSGRALYTATSKPCSARYRGNADAARRPAVAAAMATPLTSATSSASSSQARHPRRNLAATTSSTARTLRAPSPGHRPALAPAAARKPATGRRTC